MKFLLVVCLAVAVSAYEPITTNYHEEVGIPEAARIKLAEEAMDFDGSRIVGGSASSLGAHPFMAGLVIQLESGRESICGSSLISNTRLVGAAHCWRDARNQARQFIVVLGSIRIFSGGVRQVTTRVTLHENYNPTNLNNDVSIITINHVSYTNNINRINLASGNQDFIGQYGLAIGFGRTGDAAQVTQNQALRHANLQIINNDFCTRIYGNVVVVASTLCTAGGRQNVCGGDSGGPLVIGTGANRQLVGIVSFGSSSGCGRGHPAGFARVTAFNSWISRHI
ncbi:collagenase-like [Maniola jurtina]|uniref:collagenase-like n=1 Tax=Maniola jurtina TaxID=191418 RepID=UPI001E68A728|nr:collagenase-like [Maniola jurtina]